MDAREAIRRIVDQLRMESFFDERDVEARLSSPALRGLGGTLAEPRTSEPTYQKTRG